ncbi:MAG: JAB domain-containing protein [Deltaproteobacteria bacterium]|nr:JAB domain-containing protein [Deltaproteobacteria bacterium]
MDNIRKRYKFNGYRLDGITNSEILNFLLSLEDKKCNLSGEELIKKFGGLDKAIDFLAKGLFSGKGVTDGSLLSKIVKNLTYLYLREQKNNFKITAEEDILKILKEKGILYLNTEILSIMYLNSKNDFIELEIICEGSFKKISKCKKKKIIDQAFRYNANALILTHNYPSCPDKDNSLNQDQFLVNDFTFICSALEMNLLEYLVMCKECISNNNEECGILNKSQLFELTNFSRSINEDNNPIINRNRCSK